MTLVITVDAASPVPPFEQVRAQLALLIGSGALARGQRLPTVRQLARDLALAPGTVARAFRELEQAGLVKAGGTRGTTVTGTANQPTVARSLDRLDQVTSGYLATARSLGFDAPTIVAAVERGLHPASR